MGRIDPSAGKLSVGSKLDVMSYGGEVLHDVRELRRKHSTWTREKIMSLIVNSPVVSF